MAVVTMCAPAVVWQQSSSAIPQPPRRSAPLIDLSGDRWGVSQRPRRCSPCPSPPRSCPMPFTPAKKGAAALATVAVFGIGGSAIAGAAPTAKKAQASGTTTTKTKANNNETPLTGSDLTKASDAAIAANPGATVDRASTEDPAESTGAAYEVKITKADKTHAEVLLDSSFTVL